MKTYQVLIAYIIALGVAIPTTVHLVKKKQPKIEVKKVVTDSTRIK